MPVARFLPAAAVAETAVEPPVEPPAGALTAAELAEALRISLAAAGPLLESAGERVEQYAPRAPQSVKNEALIRFAGYWVEARHRFGAIASETLGPKTKGWTVNHADAFRRSGAAGLLSSWRIRRAGAIG